MPGTQRSPCDNAKSVSKMKNKDLNSGLYKSCAWPTLSSFPCQESISTVHFLSLSEMTELSKWYPSLRKLTILQFKPLISDSLGEDSRNLKNSCAVLEIARKMPCHYTNYGYDLLNMFNNSSCTKYLTFFIPLNPHRNPMQLGMLVMRTVCK